MKFAAKHAGKWVASKNEKVIASAKTLTTLRKKIGSKENFAEITFALIPKGYIVG